VQEALVSGNCDLDSGPLMSGMDTLDTSKYGDFVSLWYRLWCKLEGRDGGTAHGVLKDLLGRLEKKIQSDDSVNAIKLYVDMLLCNDTFVLKLGLD
jgi:hypothetical protein